MDRSSDLTATRRRLIAAALVVAVINTSAACTTTRSVAVSPTPPPAEADNVKIVGVETVEGDSYAFVEPAQFTPSAWAPEHLVGQAETTYRGEAAGLQLELEVSEIAEYQLATEKKELSTIGALAGVGFLAIFIALVAQGAAPDFEGLGCCD